MNFVLPIAYVGAFLFFAALLVFAKRLPPFRFPLCKSPDSPKGTGALFLITTIFAVFQLAAIFVDPNFESQEAGPVENMSQLHSVATFFYSYRPHQLLYNGIIFLLAKAFQAKDLYGIIILGRCVSTVFLLAGVFFFRRVLDYVDISDRAKLASILLFLFNPLHFFYANQAESYAMFAFAAAINSYFFLSLGRSTFHQVGFAVTALIGYFTHLFFVLVPASQMIFVAWLLISRRKSFRPFYEASLFIIPVLYVFRSQIIKIPDGGAMEFLDGYFAFDPLLFWDQFCSFFCAIDLPFGLRRPVTYLLSALFVLWCGVLSFRNRHRDSTAYFTSVALVHVLSFFVIFVTNMVNGYISIYIRHYIAAVAPFMLLASLSPLSPKHRRFWKVMDRGRAYLFLLVLSCFIVTDASFVLKNYRVDAIGARAYLEQLAAKERLICFGLTGWSIGLHIHPALYLLKEEDFEKPYSKKLCETFTYYRTEYVEKKNATRFNFCPDEFRSNQSSPSLLVDALTKDGFDLSARGDRSAIEILNDFLQNPEATPRLQEMARKKDLDRFPVKLLSYFLPLPWRVQYHNRVLIEFLYPHQAPQTWYPKFDRKGKILQSIEQDGKTGDLVVFFYTREQILGFENVDLKIQDEHLAFMYTIPSLRFVGKKSFTNIDIYLFRIR